MTNLLWWWWWWRRVNIRMLMITSLYCWIWAHVGQQQTVKKSPTQPPFSILILSPLPPSSSSSSRIPSTSLPLPLPQPKKSYKQQILQPKEEKTQTDLNSTSLPGFASQYDERSDREETAKQNLHHLWQWWWWWSPLTIMDMMMMVMITFDNNGHDDNDDDDDDYNIRSSTPLPGSSSSAMS